MVNVALKRRAARPPPRYGTVQIQRKYGFPSVNKSFSKRFKFAENSRRIRFECAQKREQPLQSRLLAV
jgi:hypothetical protein